jgi:DNA mismatch repair protein MutS
LSVSVKDAGDRIIFLHRVEPGTADRSYGIEVARLAGLPVTVIERAREVLRQHEIAPESGPVVAPMQIRLFEPGTDELKERIRALKIDEMRPVEALRVLEELQRDLT